MRCNSDYHTNFLAGNYLNVVKMILEIALSVELKYKTTDSQNDIIGESVVKYI